MASIKKGICPSCGKDRELAFFQLGVIKSTMCVHCLERYLKNCVIPLMINNNSVSENESMISGDSDA